jgi:hypothetical protein
MHIDWRSIREDEIGWRPRLIETTVMASATGVVGQMQPRRSRRLRLEW